MKNNHDYAKIYIEMKEGEWHGFSSESVWARKLTKNEFELLNSPFYAKGISIGDIILGKLIDGDIYLASIKKRSGNSTYRIYIENDQLKRFQNYWCALEKMGCRHEFAELENGRLYSVNIPASADIHEAYNQLVLGENNGVWDFEEGHLQHKV